jgi:hypothetical protein
MSEEYIAVIFILSKAHVFEENEYSEPIRHLKDLQPVGILV